MRAFLSASLLVVLAGCPEKPKPVPESSGRCEVDLSKLGAFAAIGSGASAKKIEAATDLIGGGFAKGQVGDYLLANDRVRVVISAPGREISANPYGGAIVDADLVRAGPGRDEFGKMTIVHSFGRTINVSKVEVLNDGAKGGYAVLAATGRDEVIDYIDVPTALGTYLGDGLTLTVDPNQAVPLLATTYYVLSPGETRVRMLTAFCNEGRENLAIQMGDLIDQGGSTEFFNPEGCTNGFGAKKCLLDPAPWVGYQAEGVAYGYRSYKFANLQTPAASAVLTITGISAVMAEGENQQGLLSWLDPAATRRPGVFGVLAGQSRNFLRDFYVGRDLAEISGTILALDALPKARLVVTVQNSDGTPAPGARVSLVSAESSKMVTALVTDDTGKARVDAAPGNYLVSTGAVGRGVEAAKPVAIPSSGEATVTVKLGASQKLTVRVRDEQQRPVPARVVLKCPGATCANTSKTYRSFSDVENLPSNVQAVEFVGASGDLTIEAPVGQYEVFVSHGPEYSAWPDTFPTRGQTVDLTTAPATVNATLVHVVDTTGWMSADLHVHAINSADSSVPNAVRVASFAAEGVDIMVSTDHDYITDYGPIVRDLGLSSQMATMIGAEVTPFNYGHQNAYPLTVGGGSKNGAFDWGNAEGPSLRLEQLYSALHEQFPNVVVQMNHPRGGFGGSLTSLEVDTATGATHALPAKFRMEPRADATAADTKLMSFGFDAFEVMNGFAPRNDVMNDWMTFLSRGLVKTATGVSDTHTSRDSSGGYGRTWVKLGTDDVSRFDAAQFATQLKAHRALVSSGLFMVVTAQKLDAMDQPVGATFELGDTVSIAAGQKVKLNVDIQAPEWVQFDSLELYTHASGRESTMGVSNDTWPANRIAQVKSFDPTMLPLEPVPGAATARRVHVRESFVVSPTADTWFVVMARGGTASRGLGPMAWEGVGCNKTTGICTASDSRPVALTNPIFVDADGSGAYDLFPLRGQQLTAAPPKAKAKPAARVPTMAELEAALTKVVEHNHQAE